MLLSDNKICGEHIQQYFYAFIKDLSIENIPFLFSIHITIGEMQNLGSETNSV